VIQIQFSAEQKNTHRPAVRVSQIGISSIFDIVQNYGNKQNRSREMSATQRILAISRNSYNVLAGTVLEGEHTVTVKNKHV
jgi:hypothetical protein